MIQINVQDGINWTVIVYKCPNAIVDKVLISLFGLFEKHHNIIFLPHYMIRDKLSYSEVVVSVRLLRNREDEGLIRKLLSRTLQGFNLEGKYVFDPQADHELFKYHAWIPHGETNHEWNWDQCEILNQLSLLCISLMKKDLFFYSNKNCSREHSVHLMAWMLGIYEFQRLYFDRVVDNDSLMLKGIHFPRKIKKKEFELSSEVKIGGRLIEKPYLLRLNL